MIDKKTLHQKAIQLLQDACCSFGILASPNQQDNYQRLWSRDSMIAGIAGLLEEDETIIEGWRKAIQTLAAHQHKWGMIPSNVLPHEEKNSEISYGSLAGRVDATAWFVVGSCLYLFNRDDPDLKIKLRPNLKKALTVLDYWEFNGNGLVYTPLSGNWADEYPVQGHTLYDNLLRIWGIYLYEKLYSEPELESRYELIRNKIALNFWPENSKTEDSKIYHQRAFEALAKEGVLHFPCCVGPNGYNHHFDAAGHGLAYLLDMVTDAQHQSIDAYLKQNVFKSVGADLMPAFWPVIKRDHPQWKQLIMNYSYSFKNEPYHFQNGGIWPVWMGLFALGYTRKYSQSMASSMLEAWLDVEEGELSFCEYISTDKLEPSGKEKLSFSASGLIFLLKAITGNAHSKLHLPS